MTTIETTNGTAGVLTIALDQCGGWYCPGLLAIIETEIAWLARRRRKVKARAREKDRVEG